MRTRDQAATRRLRSRRLSGAGALLAIVVLAGASLGTGRPSAAASSAALERGAEQLRAWVASDSRESAQEIATRVGQGLPPVLLAVLLDACVEHPRTDLLPTIKELARYRQAPVRGRAFMAWARLGGHHSDVSMTQAADDLEPGVRRVAFVLTLQYPSPVADQVAAQLLEKDPELADFVAEGGPGLPGPQGVPQPEAPATDDADDANEHGADTDGGDQSQVYPDGSFSEEIEDDDYVEVDNEIVLEDDNA